MKVSEARREIEQIVASVGEGIDYGAKPYWKYLVYRFHATIENAKFLLRLGRSKPSSRDTTVFEHIAKTAGTTFYSSYLRAAFPPGRRYFIRQRRLYRRADLWLARSLLSLRESQVRIVAGHDCEELRVHFPQARYITLIRDPVERTVSALFHALYHDKRFRDLLPYGITETTAGEVDPPKLLADIRAADPEQRLRILFEPYAFTLLGLKDCRERCPHSLLESDLHRLIERINSRFYLVGITEEFDHFLFLLHMELGWPLLLVSNRMVRAERAEHKLTAEHRAAIEATNPLDRILYDRLKQEFSQRFDRVVTGNARLAFDRYCKAAEKFRCASDDASIAEPYVDESQIGELIRSLNLPAQIRAQPGVEIISQPVGCRVTTLDVPWSDIVMLSFDAIDHPSVALIDLDVEAGAVGVSNFDVETRTATSEAVRSPQNGRTRIAIPLAKPGHAATIRIRNFASHGQSRFVLQGVARHRLRPIPAGATTADVSAVFR